MAASEDYALDPEKTWLKVEALADRGDGEQRAEIVKAPSPDGVGLRIEPQHRVIEVCVGAEHGVLRTDAGIAFTWGDNRYGQLGRALVLKEENCFPYPVLDLLDSEVVQVAAGKNHCLALISAGTVKAWGRNKSGQLGIGNVRDRVEPNWVCLDEKDKFEKLGIGGPSAGDRRIITISAGGNSSIASAANSDTWQWGEISEGFKVDDGKDKHKKHKESQGQPVEKNRPYLIACWKNKSFRTQMRKDGDKVSIRETSFSVLERELMTPAGAGNLGRLKDLTSEYQHWMDLIRDEKSKRDNERKDSGDKDKDQDEHDQGGGEPTDLQDIIAAYERDKEAVNREIDLYEKNIKSCEQQQVHNRRQIETLTHQQTKLTESKGKKSEEMLDPNTSGQTKKMLEQQLNEIRDFIEANQNTRATLLDQRSEIDKEKQRLTNELKNKKERKLEFDRNLYAIKIMSSSAKKTNKASDPEVQFLGSEKNQLNHHFENTKPIGAGTDILAAKEKLEKDEQYLRRVAERTAAQMKDKEEDSRALRCKSMLDDLVTLRRQLNDMIADSKYKDDFDFEHFFTGQDNGAR